MALNLYLPKSIKFDKPVSEKQSQGRWIPFSRPDSFDFQTECVLTLSRLFENHKRQPLALYFDGGALSLYLGKLLKNNHIPFYFVSAYHKDLDIYLSPLNIFSSDNKIEVQKVLISPEEFLTSEDILKLSVQYPEISLEKLFSFILMQVRQKTLPSVLAKSDFVIFANAFPVFIKNEFGLQILETGFENRLQQLFNLIAGFSGELLFFKNNLELYKSIFNDTKLKSNFLNLQNNYFESKESENIFLESYQSNLFHFQNPQNYSVFAPFQNLEKKFQSKKSNSLALDPSYNVSDESMNSKRSRLKPTAYSYFDYMSLLKSNESHVHL